MTMKNKRGLSDIVATLIIILLVIVAAGIIWVVVRNVVQSGAEQVEFGQKCFQVNLQYVGVTNTTETDYDVTLRRLAGGDEIVGVKVTLLNATQASTPYEFGSIGELETLTRSIEGVLGATKMEYTAYFEDSSGAPVYCQTRDHTFA